MDLVVSVEKVLNETLGTHLPQEIIDLIMGHYYHYPKKLINEEIKDRKGKKSIHWNPSERLRELLKDEGCLQLKATDGYPLHFEFIDFWSFSRYG